MLQWGKAADAAAAQRQHDAEMADIAAAEAARKPTPKPAPKPIIYRGAKTDLKHKKALTPRREFAGVGPFSLLRATWEGFALVRGMGV